MILIHKLYILVMDYNNYNDGIVNFYEIVTDINVNVSKYTSIFALYLLFLGYFIICMMNP